jgi:hypothetical protein
MAQIGFTAKQEHVYDRFQTLRRAYADKHGRTYAPGFLTVLMNEWEEAQSTRIAQSSVSLQAYAANAEANDPQYLEPENETE